MRANIYVAERQAAWARRRGIQLIGSQIERGRRLYTPTQDENLFEPLSTAACQQIKDGDGNELKGNEGNPAKMQAVHSSSALGVNIFHYWQSRGDAKTIAHACGLPAAKAEKICFECNTWSISSSFRYAPNIDVVIFNSDQTGPRVSAIECKFTEAYCGRGHGGLDPKYLQLDGDHWDELPRMRRLAETVSPHDGVFEHLHPAQLFKHVLALKRAFGKAGFRLLYLWYDALGAEGAKHQSEVARFAEAAAADRVAFQSLTYQELIVTLCNRHRAAHTAYVDYLCDRYL